MAPGATQRPWALIRADRSPDLFEPDLFEPCLFESEQDKLEAETWARSEDEGVFPG